MGLIFSEDIYLQELQDQGNAIWVVTLSDGTTAYGWTSSDWIELIAYCLQRQHFVLSLRMKFRQEWLVALPNSEAAYYFSQGCFGHMGDSSRASASLGYVRGDGRMTIHRYSLPDFTYLTTVDYPKEKYRDDPRIAPGCAGR